MACRNIYLSSDQRNIARLIPDALKAAVLSASKGFSVRDIKEQVIQTISQSDLISLEYIEILSNDLTPITPGVVGRILIAVKLGETRLIDNMPILLKESL